MREEQMYSLMARRARELGKSFKALAEDAGLARTYLYKLVAGDTCDPSVRTLIRLAAAMEVSPVLLFRHYGMSTCSVSSNRNEPRSLARAQGILDSGDAIEFVADVTIPNHAVVHAGEAFRKVWEVQNVGSVPWRKRRLVRVDDQYVIARKQADGSLLPLFPAYLVCLSNVVNVPDTLPNQVARIEVDFAAPPESGSIASIWRIEHDTGVPCFGPHFFLQVIVTVVVG